MSKVKRQSPEGRARQLTTAEGLSLPLTIASRSARAGALLLDLALMIVAVILFLIAAIAIGVGTFSVGEGAAPGIELLAVIVLLFLFFARFGYFLWFELGPRGATPGKRALGIRVVARGGGRLTAEAVIARNLLRDVEVFIPVMLLITGQAAGGVINLLLFAWLAIFLLFPCFNRDNLRAGDLVAGTWVVETDRRKLPDAMSVSAQGVPAATVTPAYQFGDAELSVYGEHELQVLESVLRNNQPEAMRKVMDAICIKIGWTSGAGDERAFLEAFYAALRARLERNMRFGNRKKDKFS
ncbi:RDD family protein [Altererythrobacter xixiisoli]|uniref:RDD family protein n=1 Tax=Croceibacterium xixiisoli TaxID=1476466 RepID=A0A6I4TPR8_9SPHN|nr:RDD family protein [Croceibacterium xixiisoli]MXO97894.1 RDD family protein [Croceibacterium xixiisoli]